MENTKKRKFTAVTLVIIIVIVAVLAAVLIPICINKVKKANEEKARAERIEESVRLMEARNAYTSALAAHLAETEENKCIGGKHKNVDGTRWTVTFAGTGIVDATITKTINKIEYEFAVKDGQFIKIKPDKTPK